MKANLILIISILFIQNTVLAQDSISHSIQGQIVDADNSYPLPGVQIYLDSLVPGNYTLSDYDGNFKITNVQLGRHNLIAKCPGYQETILSNLLVNSGKELIINIRLKPKIANSKTVNQIVFKSNKKSNEMTTTSTNEISAEQFMKYSGSMGDVSRMAQNYAGISGAGDDRNDIIVRGNSPSNVIWRMEGVDIPSPNHWSSFGTSGGPVSLLNVNNLRTSDFLSGAFPAEFGNSVGAVFDLNLRNGNRNKTEFLGQLGFNGFELGAEGPIKGLKNASYIINYRYSTLALVNQLGLDFGTGFAVPKFQDITFKVNMPSKKLGSFSVWGIGGISRIEFKAEPENGNLYNSGEENLIAGARTGIIGLKHKYFFNKNFSSQISLAASNAYGYSDREENIDTSQLDYFQKTFHSDNRQSTYTANLKLNYKVNDKNIFVLGFNQDLYDINLTDSILIRGAWFNELEYQGKTSLIRSFLEWKHTFSNRFSLVSGVNYQTFTLNNSTVLEPRLGLVYNLSSQKTISFGFGKHAQLQPLPIYFSKDNTASQVENEMNKNLDFTKSNHFVLGYTYTSKKHFNVKVETYYQQLYSIANDPNNPDYSIINTGANFGFPNTVGLSNDGEGTNYGLELTLNKPLKNGFYTLFTTSLFQSTYEGKDGKTRNTYYNSNYVFNLLAGKEFKKNDRLTYTFDMRFTYSGGRRYTPILLDESKAANKEILDETRFFEAQLAPYIRPDIKLGLRYNAKKVTHNFFIDFQNVIGRENELFKSYSKSRQRIKTEKQRGFFPDVRYQILF